MKNSNVLAAFICGAVAGAVLGILFAPDKGYTTRDRIAEALRRKGINLGKGDLMSLVDEIAGEITGNVSAEHEVPEND